MNNQARVQFASWLKDAHPALFREALAEADGQLGEAEAAPTKSFWQKFSDAATGLGTTYLTLKNQRDVLKMNLTRAQQGLPPLDAATTAPVVRTQVDVSPELANKLVSTAGEGINKTLLMVGGGVLAFLLARKFL